MTRPVGESEYERWANGKPCLLNMIPDFPSDELRKAGEGIRTLKARADSIGGLKTNFTTSGPISRSHRPGAPHALQLHRIDCEKDYERCLSGLRPHERPLVIGMVINGVPAAELATPFLKKMNARAAADIIRQNLCIALWEIAPEVRRVFGDVGWDAL
jgi:hypothetical protein